MYELDESGTLNCKTTFGCQSDWVDLVLYTRKMITSRILKGNMRTWTETIKLQIRRSCVM